MSCYIQGLVFGFRQLGLWSPSALRIPQPQYIHTIPTPQCCQQTVSQSANQYLLPQSQYIRYHSTKKIPACNSSYQNLIWLQHATLPLTCCLCFVSFVFIAFLGNNGCSTMLVTWFQHVSVLLRNIALTLDSRVTLALVSHVALTLVSHVALTLVSHIVLTLVGHVALTIVSHVALTLVSHVALTLVSHAALTIVSHVALTLVSHIALTLVSHVALNLVSHFALTLVSHIALTLVSHIALTLVNHVV